MKPRKPYTRTVNVRKAGVRPLAPISFYVSWCSEVNLRMINEKSVYAEKVMVYS